MRSRTPSTPGEQDPLLDARLEPAGRSARSRAAVRLTRLAFLAIPAQPLVDRRSGDASGFGTSSDRPALIEHTGHDQTTAVHRQASVYDGPHPMSTTSVGLHLEPAGRSSWERVLGEAGRGFAKDLDVLLERPDYGSSAVPVGGV